MYKGGRNPCLTRNPSSDPSSHMRYCAPSLWRRRRNAQLRYDITTSLHTQITVLHSLPIGSPSIQCANSAGDPPRHLVSPLPFVIPSVSSKARGNILCCKRCLEIWTIHQRRLPPRRGKIVVHARRLGDVASLLCTPCGSTGACRAGGQTLNVERRLYLTASRGTTCSVETASPTPI